MTLKAIISADERGALSPELQAEYKPVSGREGFFVIDTSPVDGWNLEDVGGLRNALERVRNERNDLRAANQAFDGMDANAVRALMARQEEINNWNPANDDAVKTKLQELEATWQQKYDTDLKSAQSAQQEALQRYQQYRMRSDAVSAIGKYAPKAVEVLLPHVMTRLGVFGDGDQEGVYVVGNDGKPAITKKAGETGNMTADELVQAMKADAAFAPLFPGSGASGGGSTGGTGGSPNTNSIDPKLPPAERLRLHRERQTAN